MVDPEKMLSPDHQVHRAHQDHLASQDPTDPLEMPDSRPNRLRPRPETLDPRVHLVHRGPQAPMVSQVSTDSQVDRARKDHPETLAPQAIPAPTDSRARRDHQDPPEKRVSARNTALWTAVSSSRMEPDAKRNDHPRRSSISNLFIIETGDNRFTASIVFYLFVALVK